MQQKIKSFFQSPAFAVIGASSDRSKYGNIVLRTLLQREFEVYPVNPKSDQIEGLKVIKDISQLPSQVKSIVTVVPPPVTEQVVKKAADLGIKNIWMQPGSDSSSAIKLAEEMGINVIYNNCVIQFLKPYNSRSEVLRILKIS